MEYGVVVIYCCFLFSYTVFISYFKNHLPNGYDQRQLFVLDPLSSNLDL